MQSCVELLTFKTLGSPLQLLKVSAHTHRSIELELELAIYVHSFSFNSILCSFAFPHDACGTNSSQALGQLDLAGAQILLQLHGRNFPKRDPLQRTGHVHRFLPWFSFGGPAHLLQNHTFLLRLPLGNPSPMCFCKLPSWVPENIRSMKQTLPMKRSCHRPCHFPQRTGGFLQFQMKEVSATSQIL